MASSVNGARGKANGKTDAGLGQIHIPRDFGGMFSGDAVRRVLGNGWRVSKGSQRRPQQIDEAEMERRWQMAFGKRRKSWQEVVAEAWDDVRREFPHLFADETVVQKPTKREG